MASNSEKLNGGILNSVTLKTISLKSGASLVQKELFKQLNILAVVMMRCFATAHQSTQYVAQ